MIYFIWFDFIAFGYFGIQFLDIGEAADEASGAAMRQLAMEHEFGLVVHVIVRSFGHRFR